MMPIMLIEQLRQSIVKLSFSGTKELLRTHDGIADDLIEDLIDNVFTRPQIRLASLVGALR